MQAQEPRERQPDDVEVVALDPGDQRGAAALDGVAAGAALPLAVDLTYQSTVAAVERAEVDLGDLDRRRPRPPPSRASAIPPTTWCVRPARRPRNARACASSRGLPRMSPSSATSVSAPEHELAGAAHGQRLAPRVLGGDRARVARGLLVDARTRPRRRCPPARGSPAAAARRRRGSEVAGRTAFASRSAGLGRVGAVDHVLADLDREVAADRAGDRPRAGWWRRSPGARRDGLRRPRAPSRRAGRR